MEKQTKPSTTSYQLTLSRNAIQNIDEITDYIALVNQQPLNAIKVVDTIFETLQKIEVMPYAFKECGLMPTKTKMYRQAKCLSWYIIYKITLTRIKVLGIIHTSRKPSKIKALKKIK